MVRYHSEQYHLLLLFFIDGCIDVGHSRSPTFEREHPTHSKRRSYFDCGVCFFSTISFSCLNTSIFPCYKNALFSHFSSEPEVREAQETRLKGILEVSRFKSASCLQQSYIVIIFLESGEVASDLRFWRKGLSGLL